MYGCIVNKTAGNGKGYSVWKKVERVFKSNDVPYIVLFTKGPQDALTLTNELLHRHVKAVIAVGGDGTVNETASALVHTDIPLGIVPAGSGNDFARCLGIAENTQQALTRIFTHDAKQIDVLQIGEQYCFTVTGIGFDAEVASTVNTSSSKKWFNRLKLGRLAYAASVFKVLRSFHPTNIQITIDGEEFVFSDVWLVAAGNAPNYGGNIPICPKAVPNDGWMDVCVVHSKRKRAFLRVFPKIYLGKHGNDQSVRFFKAKDVFVRAEKPLLVQSDGELITQTPVRVQIINAALRVL